MNAAIFLSYVRLVDFSRLFQRLLLYNEYTYV